jgi:hypothetical protein
MTLVIALVTTDAIIDTEWAYKIDSLLVGFFETHVSQLVTNIVDEEVRFLLKCILQITANENIELNETFWLEYIEAVTTNQKDEYAVTFQEQLMDSLLMALFERCLSPHDLQIDQGIISSLFISRILNFILQNYKRLS